MNQATDRKLRSDEEFVICSLAAHFAGAWWPGEDPPDAYLKVGDEAAAVEISTLTQLVGSLAGASRPRLSEDITALRLANQLNVELSANIPDGWFVMLVLASPIVNARRVKVLLKDRIIILAASPCEAKVTEHILGNCVELHVMPGGKPSSKKVVCAVTNQNSSADILLNARNSLEDRLVVKAAKCRSLRFDGPLWLALFNDYWLADSETLQLAAVSVSVDHPFKKVLLVSGNKSVTELHPK